MAEEEEDMGMADKMMDRGRRVRMLREMELAAEREAAEEGIDSEEGGGDEGENGGKDEVNEEGSLLYSSYLAHQRYYDDLKHVDYKAIEYDFLGGEVKVTIRQDKSLGKGGLCWDAAFCLTEHLLRERGEWMKEDGGTTKIVELGAGTGMVGICLAKALEGEGGEGKVEIVTTDLPELMGLIGTNVKKNGGRGKGRVSLEHRALSWSLDEEAEIERNGGEPFDVVIGADIVASLYDPELLVDTLVKLSGPKTKLYISFKERATSFHERFEEKLKKCFISITKTINPEIGSRNFNPGVGILRLDGEQSGGERSSDERSGEEQSGKEQSLPSPAMDLAALLGGLDPRVGELLASLALIGAMPDGQGKDKAWKEAEKKLEKVRGEMSRS